MSRREFFLEPAAPYRLDLTVWTLRRRPDNAVDRWDGSTYRRVLTPPSGPLEVEVVQTGPPDAPRLRVSTHGAQSADDARKIATASLERLLGLRVDLTSFHQFAAGDERLGPLADRFRGMRPPRFASVFEGVVNSIACQQVTLTLGILLLNRLAERCGPDFTGEGGPAYAFPTPERLAQFEPETLRGLGFSRQKGRAIIEAARNVVDGSGVLQGLEDVPDDEAASRLCGLRGIGRWSAEYVLLRGLGRTNIFPGDDVGARNNLRRWLDLTDALNYDSVGLTLDRWRPYKGLIYFHLLLDRLAEAGHVQATASRLRSDRESRTEDGGFPESPRQAT